MINYKIAGAAVLAIAAVAGAWIFLNRAEQGAGELAPPSPSSVGSADEPHRLSTSAARAERARNYEDIDAIEPIRKLPSAFARSEALYVVAGRADQRQLDALIVEANALTDAADRMAMLEVLLLRQLELDPRTALRTALRFDPATESRLVSSVLAAWSRTDLESAVVATRALSPAALRERAARAVLAAQAATHPERVAALVKQLGVSESAAGVIFETNAAAELADPYRAMQAALALPEGPERRDQLARLGEAWAAIAPDEAWGQAADVPDPASRAILRNAIVAAWTERDPERAFAAVAGMDDDWQREQLLRTAAVGLARRNPVRAMELARTLPSSDQMAVMAGAATEWAKYDVAGAAQWLEGQTSRRLRMVAYQIAPAYAAQDPTEALAWAKRLDRSGRRGILASALTGIATQNPEEALRLASAVEGANQRTQAMSSVLTVIAERDPALAMSQLEKLPPGQLRARVASNIALRIADKDPGAALDWLAGIDAPSRRDALMQLGYNLPQFDPDVAARLIDRVPAEARDTWITTIANTYAQSDPDAAVQWMKKYQNDPAYGRLMRDFVSRLAFSDPDMAIELAERATDAREREQILSRIVEMTAHQQPDVAARLITRLPDDGRRPDLVRNVAAQWSSYDPEASRRWVQSLPSGEMRDYGLAGMLSTGSASIDDTLSLARQIQSESTRMDAVMQAAIRFMASDIDAARTLLRRMPLDPRRQSQVQSMAKEQYGIEL
jgi:hypothetical protein